MAAYANPANAQAGLTAGLNPSGGALSQAQTAAINNAASLVPTRAPGVSTQTPVVSSGPAANHVTGTIIPTMNQAQGAITAQNTARAGAATNPQPQPQTQQTQQPPTPEQQIADTPESNNKWIYDASGNRVQIGVNDPVPMGYSPTNPKQAPSQPVTDTAQTDTGSYAQYQDGTFGRFDVNGQYQGQASGQEFQDAQMTESVKKGLLSAINGTYPLTPAQQAQIDGIEAKWGALITQQKIANENFTGGVTVAENLYGMGNSIAGMGAIKASIDAGIQKISDLDAQMTSAVGTMQQSFQDSNFSKLKDSYNVFNTAQKDRQAAIDKIQADMTAAAKDARDAIHQKLQDTIASTTLSDKEKQDAIQNAFQSQQITETQRHNLQTEAVARADSLKGRYQYDPATGSVFNTQTGQLVDTADPANAQNGAVTPGKTGDPLLDSNTFTSVSGVPFINGTNLKGKQAENVQLKAAKLGIPYLGAAGADAIANIDTARANLQNISEILKTGGDKGNPISPSNSIASVVSRAEYPVMGFFQDGTLGKNIASYGTFRSAAIEALRAVAGSKGLRINQAEIAMSIANDIPSPSDTPEVRDQKIANMNSMLDAQEQGLFGTTAYNAFNPNNSNPLGISKQSAAATTPSPNNPLGI